jgi:hypothetical protein
LTRALATPVAAVLATLPVPDPTLRTWPVTVTVLAPPITVELLLPANVVVRLPVVLPRTVTVVVVEVLFVFVAPVALLKLANTAMLPPVARDATVRVLISVVRLTGSPEVGTTGVLSDDMLVVDAMPTVVRLIAPVAVPSLRKLTFRVAMALTDPAVPVLRMLASAATSTPV